MLRPRTGGSAGGKGACGSKTGGLGALQRSIFTPRCKPHSSAGPRSPAASSMLSSPPGRGATSALDSRRPSQEQIVVTEADFLRCGNDLKQLRQFDLRRGLTDESLDSASDQPPGAPPMSFKMAFERECRQALDDVRDPWKGLKNPELARPKCEADMVLNQVWETALSESAKVVPDAEGEVADGVGQEKRLLRRRRTAKDAGVSHEGSSAVEVSKPRTACLEDFDIPEGDDPDAAMPGSWAIREATRAQRHGLRALEGQLHYDSEPRAAWLALDVKRGEVQPYEHRVAERLEAAHHTRASVPLVGLGKDVDAAIVTFGEGADRVFGTETSESGRERDIQRIPVPATVSGVDVRVVKEGSNWRFLQDRGAQEASVPKGATVESRRVPLASTEVVERFELPTLMDRHRKTYFLNIGSELF